MTDNVGLSTPRGSGTSGYVQRNLAHLKPRDRAAPYPPPRGGGDLAGGFHRPRQPDQGILEHERKREVEVRVMELRDRLEDEGKLDDDAIDDRCDALRKELLAELDRPPPRGPRGGGGGGGGGGGADRGPRNGGGSGKGGIGLRKDTKALKMHQVHELADAKIRQDDRFRRALKISKDYEEGSHWRRQEDRMRRAVEREEQQEDEQGAAEAEEAEERRRRQREVEDDEEDRGRGGARIYDD